jgi:hypothetical protein
MSKDFVNIEYLNELEHFFETINLPEAPFKLDSYSTIINVPLFIQSHFNIVKLHTRNIRFKPYLDRLIQFKNSINLKLENNDY